MKVGLVLPGFSANERDWCIPALLDYVRVLAKRAEVHVFTLRWPEQSGLYRVHGATVHALGGGRRLGPRAPGLWARAARAIGREHRRARFDVLHAFWADEPGWVTAWTAGLLGLPAVLSLAGGELSRLPEIGYGLELLPGRRALVRRALRKAKVVTAGSLYLCDQARARGIGRDVIHAPLGVDTRLFVPPARPAEAPTILSVGSLVPVKDHARLLRALRKLVTLVPAVQLLIAGEGPLASELACLASGLPVRFLGAVDHGALPAIYGQASVLVQASRHEAQGMAVLEAAACGVAPIGTPVGVLPEVGRVVASEAEMVEGLRDLLCERPGRQALAHMAREHVVRAYGLETAVDRFEQIYVGLSRR